MDENAKDEAAPEKLPIGDLKEAVGFGLTLGETVEGVLNGIDGADAVKLMEVIQKAPAAVKGYENIIPQAADLDDEERAELKKFVEEDFDLDSDNIEIAVETALKVAIDLSKLVGIFVK